MQTNNLILRLIGDSRWTTSESRRHAGKIAPRIQDSTSVQSVSHQIGIILREPERARENIIRETGLPTCNPLLIPNYTGEGHEFPFGNSWDATVLGRAAQLVNSCLTRLAVLTKGLAARLLHDGQSHGLLVGLSGGEVGINSGMLLLHTSAAVLIPEIQLLASPVGILSFPLKSGQEDFYTMAMATINGLRANSRRFDQLLIVLFVISGQGIHLLGGRMRESPLGTRSTLIHKQLRTRVTSLDQDRVLTSEADALTDAINRGEFPVMVYDLLEDQGRDQATQSPRAPSRAPGAASMRAHRSFSRQPLSIHHRTAASMRPKQSQRAQS